MESDNVGESSSVQIELKLYGLRWWITVFIGLVAIMTRMIRGMFGVVNDVYVAYFKLTYMEVDWFTLAPIPGMVLISLFLIVLIFLKIVVIRKLAVTMAICLVLLSVCHLTAYIWPDVFPLMFIAQLLLGLSYVALDAVSASFALSWFPEHQVGIALAAKSIGSRFGSLLGYVIPGNLFVSPSSNDSYLNAVDFNTTREEWFQKNQIRFIAFSGASLFVSVVILIFFSAFFYGKPPSPPTAAQALLRTIQTETKLSDIFKTFQAFYQACSNILLNKVFLQVSFILSVVTSCFVVQKMLMGEMFRRFFIDLDYLNQANAMSGVCLVLFEITAMLGSTISGKLVDRYKNYQYQIGVGLLLSCIVTGVFSVTYHFRILIAAYILSALYGFLVCVTFVHYYEIVYQHLYPTETSLIAVLLRMISSLGSLIISQSCRFLLDKFGGTAVFIAISIFLFLSFLISIFVKPTYRRLEANLTSDSTDANKNEEQLLLSRK